MRTNIKNVSDQFADLQEAGTMRFAELRPQLAGSLFPPQNPSIELGTAVPKVPRMNMSRRRSHNESLTDTGDVDIFDEFEDDVLDDGELMAASINPACSRSVSPAVLIILHSGQYRIQPC